MTVSNVEFELIFNSGNEALTSDPHRATVDILETIVKHISAGKEDGIVRDGNGNTVGRWFLLIDREDD